MATSVLYNYHLLELWFFSALNTIKPVLQSAKKVTHFLIWALACVRILRGDFLGKWNSENVAIL
jgi:hypothetical protein